VAVLLFIDFIVDYFYSCQYIHDVGEIRCPYGCYVESLRLPGGQLLNETFGCDVRCDASLTSTDRCSEVNYLTVYLLHFK